MLLSPLMFLLLVFMLSLHVVGGGLTRASRVEWVGAH
jgi:hypothetical protein